jgi:type I restriction-modification system DNA methylase subunit
MTLTKELWRAVMNGTDSERVEELRQILKYPLKQRDTKGSRFWYLRPGVDESEAEETCPIAVGFYSELNDATDGEIKKFLTSVEQQKEIYGHYTSRISEQQPVMYLLLPTKEGTGRIPLVLPNEGGLRQRQIQTFEWNDPLLLGRLRRLEQGELPIAVKALHSVPLVEWVFYEPIKTAGELARLLAEAARRIEQIIPKVYAAEKIDGYLHKLLKSFQRELLPTLQLTSTNEKDYSFADIYAQTIAYALFTARVFSYVRDKREGRDKETHFDRESAWKQLPETNPFLRRLFQDVSERSPEELGNELTSAIAEIFGILRAAKMDAILSDFHLKMNREDIVIRFYEDFLAAYKPQMRERRGVYYTPEPVVSYMVRSVDEMLKDKFNKPLGLADPEVMILDPACGTGTFLLWICQLIYQRFQESPSTLTEGLADKSWSSYVKERLLPRIFGFELLMAPYAIAHLKLGLFLEETGYKFDSGKRLGVYLTNTLEDPVGKSEILFDEIISEEANQATDIKRNKQIMVVLGNPPYSYESGNTGKWISGLVHDYSQVDSQPLGERNPKGLQDDYVKFIRFGQWRIDLSKKGIFAFITNHGFLDNPTFRGMRQ